MAESEQQRTPEPGETTPRPAWHVPLRVLAYAAVAASLLLANAGLAWAAATTAILTWGLGNWLLLRTGRAQAAFADRFVVTLAIILAAIQVMGILVGGGGGDLPAWLGQPAPDLEVASVDGQVFRLSELEGRRVMLYFWATWCPPCRMMTPRLAALERETDDDLVILGISHEGMETIRHYAEAASIPFPMGMATSLPSPYREVQSIPTLFVIDRNGVIQNIVTGVLDAETLRDYATQRDWTPRTD